MQGRELYDPAAQTEVVWRIWDPTAGMFCSSGRSLYAKNGRSIWMSKGAAAVALGRMPAEVRERALLCAFNLVPVGGDAALAAKTTVVAPGQRVVTPRWSGGPRALDQGDMEVVA